MKEEQIIEMFKSGLLRIEENNKKHLSLWERARRGDNSIQSANMVTEINAFYKEFTTQHAIHISKSLSDRMVEESREMIKRHMLNQITGK